MRLLVIGGDAAGMSAASHVRRAVPDAEIVVFERGPYTSYSMCGIPYYISGMIETCEDLVVRSPEEFRRQGVTVHMGTEAVAIDPSASMVRVLQLATGEEREEPYDALLYAAGAHPSSPPIPGFAEYSHVVHTLAEGERIRRRLDAEGSRIERVVVVGAGYIGMEIAEALVRRGLRSTLLDRGDQVMGSLDPDMAAVVQQALEAFGVRVRLGEKVVRVEGAGGRCRTVVTAAGEIPADLLVVAVGSRPNVGIAAAAGCGLGETGALLVDGRMRTTLDRVWAAGDCVESRHLVSGRAVNVQLGTHANKQGKVAGIDIAAWLSGGQGDAEFPGVVGTAVTKVCEWEIARTGLSEAEARAAGLTCEAVRFTGTAKSGYMPEPGVVHVKMLAQARTGRVLGAQLVGTGNVGKRIDVAATWCHLGVTVQSAQLFDLSYAPPFGSVWDLLQIAARKLTRQLNLRPQL
ncbi:MAG: FAD-dependent oxidoreductase [Egibacteraceae bacterium]